MESKTSKRNYGVGGFDHNDDDFYYEDDDPQVIYSKEFVNKFFQFQSYREAVDWIIIWYKELKHNPTDFAQDFPALIDRGLAYREELLNKNPEQFPEQLIMAKGIMNYGAFENLRKQGDASTPTKDDYLFHMTFCLLEQTCIEDKIQMLIPRIILNNLAIRLIERQVIMKIPLHQEWAMEVFAFIRADLVPDFINKLKLQNIVTEELLLKIAKKQLGGNRFNDAALMIIRYKFQSHFDLAHIMHRLVDLNKLETAKMLIIQDDVLKRELIVSLCNSDNSKKAAQLIKDFHFNADDFPAVKEQIMKSSMRYFLGRNLYKKQNQQDFLTLDRVEDLLTGFKQMLSYLVEDLTQKEKPMEAKGIMIRNQLDGYMKQEVVDQLAPVVYDLSKDTSLLTYDAFECLSKPAEDYMKLPDSVKVEWIGTEEDVPKLEILLKDELVGVDSEWRPQLTQYHKTKPSLFQISGANNAFLIDLVSLQKSKLLDDTLIKVFSNETTTIIGFGFSSDIEQFTHKHPQMHFIKYVKNFIDAQTYFGKVYLVEQQTGLAKVAQRIFQKSICKVEQMSNWERRPLRQSQQHYGALDAYILIGVIKKLVEKSIQDDVAPYKKSVKTLDNRNMILNKNYVSDEFDEQKLYGENQEAKIVIKPSGGRYNTRKPNNKARKRQNEESKNNQNNQQDNNVKQNNNGMQNNNYNNRADQQKDDVEMRVNVPRQQPYGNSYGRKGQVNNTSLITNEDLRASMWEDKGFIVDRNLNKLARMLQEKGVDCMIPDKSISQDSEQICNKALETNRIFITSNLKLFNRKSVMHRCCVHYKDTPQRQFSALESFFSFNF